MRRRPLALAVVALLAVTAGCGGAGLSDEELNAPQTYDWDTDATATYDVRDDIYKAVFQVDDGQTVAAYRLLEIGGEQPISVRSVQFRYANGSILRPNGTLTLPNGTQQPGAAGFTVDREGERTVITPPSDGRVAYTAPSGSKAFRTPIVIEGSQTVILPPNTRIATPLLGTISPGGYDHAIVDGRVHLTWDQTPDEPIDLTYYLERDFYIIIGLAAALTVVGAVGVLYFRREIRKLERERKEAGIDLDQ